MQKMCLGVVQIWSGSVLLKEIQGVSLERERWFSKRSYPVKQEVLSCETEVPSGESLFHWIGFRRIGPRLFYQKNKCFCSSWAAPERHVRFTPHRHFYAYRDWSTQSYHLLEGFTGSKHWIVTIWSLRKVREQRVPDSSNHSFFPENEGNFGGNQLLKGSIGLSPLSPQTNNLPVDIETSLRQRFPWLRLFQAYFLFFPRVHTYPAGRAELSP